MTTFLPWLLITGAVAAFLFALGNLWASFRAAFGGTDGEVHGLVEAASRRALFEEKDTLLRQLSELRFDRDGGKISDADFDALDQKLRARAKQVLRLIDSDVAPFISEAEERIRERLGFEAAPYRQSAKPVSHESGSDESESDESPKRRPKKSKKKQSMSTPSREDDAADESTGSEEEAADGLDCPECETVNDADAVFCKKCGHRFESAGAASDHDPDDTDTDDDDAAEEANP